MSGLRALVDLPASVMPRKIRVDSSPAKFSTKPIPIMTPPQAIMMMGSHMDGLSRQHCAKCRPYSSSSPPSLHDHVGGDLEQDVKGEEHGETCLVLGRGEIEIDREAKEVGVTDV